MTPWTIAYQAPPCMEFPRQDYWSGLPFPSPGYIPDPGIEPRSPALQADALPTELPGKPSNLERPLLNPYFKYILCYYHLPHHYLPLSHNPRLFKMEQTSEKLSLIYSS